MSAALCLACGNVKQGAFIHCSNCGNLPEDNDLSIALTDHYLDITTLEDFGRVIKQLRGIAPDEETAMMSFLQLINERHPEIALTIATPSLEDRAKAVVYLSAIPEIRITDSPRANWVSADPIERLTASRVVHRQVRCKRCGHTQSVALWQRINPISGGVAYALLRMDKLFEVVCRGCGNIGTLRYEALYIDGNAACAVWLKPRSTAMDVATPEIPDAEFLMQLDKNFRLRIVETPEEFAEKVRILTDGWDDVLIELTKLSLCQHGDVDITDPPTYRHSWLENEERQVTFDGSYPQQCSESLIEERVCYVAAKLRSRGYAVEGTWQRVSTVSMLDMLVAAGMLIHLDRPAE